VRDVGLLVLFMMRDGTASLVSGFLSARRMMSVDFLCIRSSRMRGGTASLLSSSFSVRVSLAKYS
jgi:hypothetical protein